MTRSGRAFWRILDERIFRVERAIVIAATAVMVALVFLAVVWDQYAAPTTKFESFARQLSGSEAAWVGQLTNGLVGFCWLALCAFAFKTANPTYRWAAAAVRGVVAGVAIHVAAKLLVWLVPEGIVFSQRVALSLFMWVALLGSSMAARTRRHIFLQAAQRLIPAEKLRYHAAASLILAATFTLLLMWVGGVYSYDRLMTWVDSGMEAGVLESIPIPVWLITLSFPIGFGLTLARFVGQAIAIVGGHMDAVPPNEEIAAAESEAST